MTATIEETLARTKELSEKRQAATAKKYREFIVGVASGKGSTPSAIAEFLATSGMSSDQFATDVNSHAQRLRAKADSDALPGLRNQLEDTRAKIKAAEDKRAAAHKAADDEMVATGTPLVAESRRLEAAIRAAEKSESVLQDCPYPDLVERHRKLNKLIDDKGQRLTKLKADLVHAEDHTIGFCVPGMVGRWPGHPPSDYQSWQKVYAESAVKVKTLPTAIAEAEAELAELQAEYAEAARDLLTP